MNRNEMPTKYTKVVFHNEFEDDHHIQYAVVEFYCYPKDNKKATAFAVLMDRRIELKAKEILSPLMGVAPKNIYLEDSWLMINGVNDENKHHAAALIGIVLAAEKEFDAMCELKETQ